MFIMISFSTSKLRKTKLFWTVCLFFQLLKLRNICGKNSLNKLVKTSDEFVIAQRKNRRTIFFPLQMPLKTTKLRIGRPKRSRVVSSSISTKNRPEKKCCHQLRRCHYHRRQPPSQSTQCIYV